MPARRIEGPTSDDLFSVAAKKAPPIEISPPPTTTPPAPSDPSPRYLLPKDLPGALARLDGREIDTLLNALIDESKRRGRFTPTVRTKLLQATQGGDEGQRRGPRPRPPRLTDIKPTTPK